MTNVSKAVWGPACWTFMHTAAAVIAADEAPAFSAFMYSLARVLPCPECREHLRAYLNAHPPERDISDNITASSYCFKLHNHVNRKTGKPTQEPRLMLRLYGVRLPDVKPTKKPKTLHMPPARHSTYRIP